MSLFVEHDDFVRYIELSKKDNQSKSETEELEQLHAMIKDACCDVDPDIWDGMVSIDELTNWHNFNDQMVYQ